MPKIYGSLYSATGLNAPVAGGWFSVTRDERTHLPIVVSLTAGTATVQIEGRNLPTDTAVVLDTLSASGGRVVGRFAQMRVNITAAAGASVSVSVDAEIAAV